MCMFTILKKLLFNGLVLGVLSFYFALFSLMTMTFSISCI